MTSTALVIQAMKNACKYTDGKVEMLLKRIEELEKKLTVAPRPEPGAKNDDLYTALSQKRLAIAREFGVPAYFVATNKMLVAVATMKPQTAEELSMLYGFGPTKVKLYGDLLLKVVADWS